MMGCFLLYNSTLPINAGSESVCNSNGFNFPSIVRASLSFPSSSTSPFTVNCKYRTGEEPELTNSSAYNVLDVCPSCSDAELKAAFRAKLLSSYSWPEIIESKRNVQVSKIQECLDPFDEPECEALDLFVTEVLCVGKGCPYSSGNRATYAFPICFFNRDCTSNFSSIRNLPYDTSAKAIRLSLKPSLKTIGIRNQSRRSNLKAQPNMWIGFDSLDFPQSSSNNRC